MSMLSIVFLAYGLPAIAGSITGPFSTWDVVAPTMDGWTQYNKMETKTDSHFQPLPDWVPMNTTGSTESGNLYIPFYDFGGDATMAGWRLAGDETSEVVYTLKDNYSCPNASYTSGHHTASSDLITMTGLTYLDAPTVASHDSSSNGTFTDLPFTSHTVWIGKESTDSFRRNCSQPWNFTATVVAADGTTSFSSAIDVLEVAVPPNTASTITLRNTADHKFSAVLSFSGETPFVYSRGSSSQIGNVTLSQQLSVVFCPADD
ncbi:hypothetical protein B0H13DRAFT_2321246 [Mycena leptocephala]|nr:hypothetical protein B0H13DRAFT_2321246 [Mycena leptocephala]